MVTKRTYEVQVGERTVEVASKLTWDVIAGRIVLTILGSAASLIIFALILKFDAWWEKLS